QWSFSQKYSNEFLSIGLSARAQAMGNAFVATVDDVTAGFWNPAALASLEMKNGIQVGAQHAEWFAGVGKYDYLGFAMPFDNHKRALGLSIIRFGIDDIPNTLSLYNEDGSVNYDNIKPFSAADYAFLTTYAQKIYTDRGKLFLGGNVKIVRRTIGPFAKSWGFGLDASVQYHVGKWRWGALLKDITNTFNAWNFNFTDEEKQILELTNNTIPIKSLEVTRPQITLGGARQFDFGKIGLTAELDMTMYMDGKRNTVISTYPFSFDPTFGVEANYKKFVFLRAGINNIQEDSDLGGKRFWTMQPNMGVGLKLYKFRLDYAFTDIGDNSNGTYSHVISMVLDVNFKYFKNAARKSK
ncbi:MAG TPA: PorV/PorQ family protein, partial [Phaeodactylibacter sp.]|nr:PorV/PorQ family protein [Phaeodactylibacter sp.]